MSKMLEYDTSTLESLDMNFVATTTSLFGEVQEHELIKNGNSQKVNISNVHQYVDQYADFLLNKSIQKSVRLFRRIKIEKRLLKIFNSFSFTLLNVVLNW